MVFYLSEKEIKGGYIMRHLGTQLLETDRLILRRFTMADTQAMFDNWASDKDVTKYLTWPAHQNTDVTKAVLEQWVAKYVNDNYYQWAIIYKENGDEPIGSISVVSQDDRIQKAQVGYCMGKKWWHKGIMSEALQVVIDFLLDKVGMQRVEARHDSNNPHSGAVMKKCGMKYEGTLRKADRNGQGICDACYYSILSTDR